MNLTVAIPTYLRHERLEKLIENFKNCTPQYPANIELRFGIEYDDQDTKNKLRRLRNKGIEFEVTIAMAKSCPKIVNYMFKHSEKDWFINVGDDCEFTEGWIEKAEKEIEDWVKVLAIYDGINPDIESALMVNRAYVNGIGVLPDEKGILYHEGFKHHYCDNELREWAAKKSVLKFTHNVIIKHLFHGFQNRYQGTCFPYDETYRREDEARQKDWELRVSRRPLFQ